MNPKKPKELAQLTGADKKNPSRYKSRGSSEKCTKFHAVKPKFEHQETSDAWDAVVPALEALQILTVQDLPEINEMFAHYEAYTTAKKILFDFDHTFVQSMMKGADQKLATLRKTYASQVSMHWNDFQKIASRFGMTPVDRANLVIPEQKQDDPLSIVLGE